MTTNNARYNFPDKDDPDFSNKVVDLIKQLFESQESPTKKFEPITAPEDSQEVGTIYFDRTQGKFKVVTEDGTKTLQFEP
jgi:hypothetical protein